MPKRDRLSIDMTPGERRAKWEALRAQLSTEFVRATDAEILEYLLTLVPTDYCLSTSKRSMLK